VVRITALLAVWEMTGRRFSSDEIVEAMRPPDLSSGDHDTDWRYPVCRHFNSIRRLPSARSRAGPLRPLTNVKRARCAGRRRRRGTRRSETATAGRGS
jgi:hypothetical protein